MGESASKALMFGVGIFVTMMIASGVIGVFSQMQEIYKQVDSTDTSITSRFGKFAMYDNTTLTGLEVINCANKYYNETFVVVSYQGAEVNNIDGITYLQEQNNLGFLNYHDKFRSTVEEVEYDGVVKTKITFVRI